MSSIYFKKIRMKNFLSVGNNWLEYDLDKYGTSGIIGKNGAGKSLLLDALCFSLYGKSYRGCNKPLLINSINERDCVTEIEFNTMNKSYKVVRSQKPNVFEIYQNGVLLNQDSKAKDYQLFLENNILKMNYKSFTQIIVLGSTNYTPFMELSAQDRRDVIEDLLDIQIFSNMRKVIKEYTSENTHMTAEHDGKMKSVQDKIEMQRNHIDRIKKKGEEQTEEKKKELREAQRQVSSIESDIEEMESEIDQKLQSISDYAEISDNMKEISIYKEKITSKIERCREVEDFYSENTECPTCHQEIREEEVKTLVEENREKQEEFTEGMALLLDQLNQFQTRITQIQETEREIRKIQALVSEKNGRISGLNNLITSLNNDIDRALKGGEDDTEYQNKLREYESELDVLQTEKVELTEYKNILKSAEIILKDNGIKSKIIKEYLPKMNFLINKYLKALDFFVEFNLDENFKETVKSRFRDVFSYESFSEGQKFRINIAILFAWRDIARLKNSAHTNILVLDEVFDSSLDSEGVEEFIKLLKAVTEDNVHVMVISHRGDTMIDKFDRVYNLHMKNNFTTMTLT